MTPIPKIKCMKFGEILIDENKNILLFCVNCLKDFKLMADFCKHLKECETVRHHFEGSKSGSKLFQNTSKSSDLLRKVNQKSRELLIYASTCVLENPPERDICDIEAEILNPRWYTDAVASSPIRTLNKKSTTYNTDAVASSPTRTLNKKSTTYNNLIEEVTPFVQFKENIRTLSTPKQETTNKQTKTLQSKVKADVIQNKRPPLPTTTATTKSQTNVQQMPRKSILELSKPACAKNLVSASTPNTVRLTLKRKSNGLPANQAISAAKPAQNSTESLLTIGQKPPSKGAIPKKCLNQTNIASTIQPQTLRFRKDMKTNNQLSSVLQKSPPNAISTQTVEQIIPCQPIGRTLLKPVAVSTAALVTAPAIPSANNKITVDILNKLQTLGLKIQRTNPAPKPPPVAKEQNTAAMEIIKKLQSKGMEIKRVPKNSPTTISVSLPPTVKTPPKLISVTANSKHINPNVTVRSTNTVSSVPKRFLLRKAN